MSKSVILQRVWMDSNQSTGSLIVLNKLRQPIYISPCIERGDRNNEQNVSNIPTGTYPLVWELSPKFGMVWELKDVPNRSECKIHAANMWNQINGCIAPGIIAEAKGNWLQRSWRPILMLSFGFIVIYNKFAAPLFGWPIPILEGEFWTLLQIGIGGYVVGRSAEKIADKITITKNK